MDPCRARELVQTGAAYLLLDVPAGTRIGLDQMSFVAGESFKGWKMVPPGAHYLTYNAASRSGEFAPTVAVLSWLASKEVFVRRWSPSQELLLPLEDEDEAGRYMEGFRRFDFDRSLAPYDLSAYGYWQVQVLSPMCHMTLTGSAHQLTTCRIAAVESNTCVTAEADPSTLRPPTAAEAQLETHLAANRRRGSAPEGAIPTNAVGRCRYSTLPRLDKSAGLTASQLTAQNLDKSTLLRSIITDQLGGSWQELLGEFQIAFVTFLFGQSLEGFAHWKEVLVIVLGCQKAALGDLRDFFVAFLHTLQAQLSIGMPRQQQSPQMSGSSPAEAIGGLIEELLPTTFLRKAIGGFISALSDVVCPPHLSTEIASLRSTLTRLGFSIDVSELGGETDDEDGPVIVEL